MAWIIVIILLLFFAEGAVPSSCDKISIQNRGKVNSAVCRTCLIIILTLMVGFWGLIAEDHPEYVEVYNSLHNYSFSNLFGNVSDILAKQAIGMELGYNIINVLGNYLNLKAPLFFTLIALFVNTCIIKFIYDYPHPVLSLFLILSMNFFLQEANLVRQILAMAIFLVSIPSLLEGKWKQYLVMILVATLFHISAIILAFFVIFHFIKTEKAQKNVFISLIVIWILSILIMCGIVSFNFLSLFSNSSYSIYAINDNAVGMEVSVPNIAFHNCVAIALILCYKSLSIKSKLFYYAIVLVTTSSINVSYVFPNFFRFATYFSVAFFVVAIYLFSKTNKWKYGKYSIPILTLQIYCGIRILVFFILQDNIFGSKSYSLNDFF